jgi:hypothetical protein
LIAGGALVGVAGAFLNFIPDFVDDETGLPMPLAFAYKYLPFLWNMDLLAVGVFGVLAWVLFREAKGKEETV